MKNGKYLSLSSPCLFCFLWSCMFCSSFHMPLKKKSNEKEKRRRKKERNKWSFVFIYERRSVPNALILRKVALCGLHILDVH